MPHLTSLSWVTKAIYVNIKFMRKGFKYKYAREEYKEKIYKDII